MAQTLSRLDKLERLALRHGKRALRLLRPQTPENCLFVCGMQRSGTNMLMDVLDRSTHTDVFHERDKRAFYRFELRDRALLHELRRASRASLTVFKALLESDQVGNLLDDFAPAKALWVVRDWRDTVASAERSFALLETTVQAMVATPGDYWQSRSVTPRTHAILSEHFNESISLKSCVALFWYARNQLYFDQDLASDPRVRLIHYEDLVTRPEQSFPGLFEFIDIPYSRWVVSKVNARSVAHRNPSDVESAIAALCQELYAKFEPPTGG